MLVNFIKYKKEIATIFILLISTAIFIGNFYVPLGFILWVLFIIPLIIAYYIYDEKYLYPLVSVFSILIILNLFTAPKAIPLHYALFNRGSGIILFFILATFMKDQKKSKKTLVEFNLNLEQMVAKRTEQLACVNKELKSFAYILAHDLKAPLRAINGFSSIMKKNHEDKFEEEEKKYLSIVIENSTRMARMIEDMLGFLELQEKEITSTEIEMSKLVKNVIDELLKNEQGRSIDFKINDLQNCKGDFIMMKQVWTSLISNALKFTLHKEKPEITIDSRPNDKEIIYQIKDNGEGFDMKYSTKLFGIFQRLHAKEKFEGNGIGLAFVKRIIEKHKGRVWAESKVNEGATFYFSLPV